MSGRERDPTVEIEKEIYKKLKKLSSNNRKNVKQFINDSLLDIVNNSNRHNNQEKDNKISELEKEIKNIKNQSDDSQIFLARVIRDVYKNRKLLFKDVLKDDTAVSQKFQKRDDLIGKSATDEKMIIFDELLKNEIIVEVKNNILTCSEHGPNFCKHIQYATIHFSFQMKLHQNGVDIPGDDEVMKDLETIANSKDD